LDANFHSINIKNLHTHNRFTALWHIVGGLNHGMPPNAVDTHYVGLGLGLGLGLRLGLGLVGLGLGLVGLGLGGVPRFTPKQPGIWSS